MRADVLHSKYTGWWLHFYRAHLTPCDKGPSPPLTGTLRVNLSPAQQEELGLASGRRDGLCA